jgi:putative transposase
MVACLRFPKNKANLDDMMIVLTRRTYKYRLYRNDRDDAALYQQLNVAGMIWNHALALQRRYYRRYHKHLSITALKTHIAKLRKRVTRYTYWQGLYSQSVQEVLERLDNAWQRFFNKQGNRPRFKKVKRYTSFVLKQSGWKLVTYNQNQQGKNGKYRRAMGKVELNGTVHKFVQHRPLAGQVKTVTVKRDSCGRLWACFSVIEQVAIPEQADLSRIGGFDFGLHTFLTDHEGNRWMHPEFFRQLLKRFRRLTRALSRQQVGSTHRERTRWLLARTYIRLTDKRRDFHYKLAHQLCDAFEVLVFEDLNLAGMKRLWGRKVSDLGFGKFLIILRQVAVLRGKVLLQIGRYERTTGKCSACDTQVDMTLKQRTFVCPNPECRLVLDRDHNAAINIQRSGASLRTGTGMVNPASAGCPV